MLDGPLAQLFLDLHNIPENHRSEYETALHGQLLELGNRLRPLSAGDKVDADWLADSLTQGERADRGVFHAHVDLGGSDIKRLNCKKPDCPNKRQ
jgi:hypothetical protein